MEVVTVQTEQMGWVLGTLKIQMKEYSEGLDVKILKSTLKFKVGE